MSNNLLHEIRDDLTTGVSFSDSLRKAMVLGNRLRTEDLKNWAKNELNGYDNPNNVPKYRILPCRSFMDVKFTDGRKVYSETRTPVNIDIEYVRVVEILDGTGALEDFIKKGKQDTRAVLQLDWQPDQFHTWSGIVTKNNGRLERVWKEVSISDIVQILESAKNRLLEFVLELENRAEEAGSRITGLNPSEVKYIFNKIVMENAEVVLTGDTTVTTFDQRGQSVNYQYNAAGDINIEAVQNEADLIEELGKLKLEIGRAKEDGAVDEDIAIDAEYQVQKAIQAIKKSEPDKISFMDHIGKAKGLLEDVTAATGLVTALIKAADLAKDIF
jgi:hypothetical protein